MGVAMDVLVTIQVSTFALMVGLIWYELRSIRKILEDMVYEEEG